MPVAEGLIDMGPSQDYDVIFKPIKPNFFLFKNYLPISQTNLIPTLESIVVYLNLTADLQFLSAVL